MVIDFCKYLYKSYRRSLNLDKERYIFKENTDYILFSGTALGHDGDIRHLNDLFFILFLLQKYDVPRENIYLAIDTCIIKELKKSNTYQNISTIIEDNIGNIIDIVEFETSYIRNKDKDLVFISSGHGNINGLHISKNNSMLTSDYFEDIACETKDTLLIMSQCYAGAFHHLDTRKNICVLGASEYQESLSLPVIKLLGNLDNGTIYFKDYIDKNLGEFILKNLAFRIDISINPFLFCLFLVMINPDKHIKSRKKHLINIYKNATSLMSNYLLDTFQHVRIQSSPDPHPQTVYIEGIRINQQSYLLNKIIASRYNVKEY